VVDKKHVAAIGFLKDSVLGLLLGPDEQQLTPVRNSVDHEIMGDFKKLDGFLEINDVNAVARPKNERFHFGIPTPGLVPEMDPRFQEFLHGNNRHTHSLASFFPPPRLPPDQLARQALARPTGTCEFKQIFLSYI
jgi:hypothetical protein